VSLRSALGVVAVSLSLRSASPFNVFSSAILTRCLFFTDSFCSVIQASSSKRLALSSNSGRGALSPSSSSSCFSLAILARRLFFTNSFCSIIQAWSSKRFVLSSNSSWRAMSVSSSSFNCFSFAILARFLFFTNSFCSEIHASVSFRSFFSSARLLNSACRATYLSSSSFSRFSLAILARCLFFTNSFCSAIQASVSFKRSASSWSLSSFFCLALPLATASASSCCCSFLFSSSNIRSWASSSALTRASYSINCFASLIFWSISSFSDENFRNRSSSSALTRVSASTRFLASFIFLSTSESRFSSFNFLSIPNRAAMPSASSTLYTLYTFLTADDCWSDADSKAGVLALVGPKSLRDKTRRWAVFKKYRSSSISSSSMIEESKPSSINAWQ